MKMPETKRKSYWHYVRGMALPMLVAPFTNDWTDERRDLVTGLRALFWIVAQLIVWALCVVTWPLSVWLLAKLAMAQDRRWEQQQQDALDRWLGR